MNLPEPMSRFLERQLGPGATPGWSYEIVEIESREGYGYHREFPWQDIKIKLGEGATADLGYSTQSEMFLRWQCDPAREEKGPLKLTNEEALERLKDSNVLPKEQAVLAGMKCEGKFNETVLTISFDRVYEDVRVVSDHVTTGVNLTTGRITDYHRTPWIPLETFGAEISSTEAKGIADAWVRKNFFGMSAARSDPRHQIVWFDLEGLRGDEISGLDFGLLCGHYRCWIFKYEERRSRKPTEEEIRTREEEIHAFPAREEDFADREILPPEPPLPYRPDDRIVEVTTLEVYVEDGTKKVIYAGHTQCSHEERREGSQGSKRFRKPFLPANR